MRYPRTAYILLWFPKPSETFIFREVMNLRDMGLPLKVFTLYGEQKKDISPEMLSFTDEVERLGLNFLRIGLADVLYWWKRNRRKTMNLFNTFFTRRWSGLEKTGESLWAFICAFHLARRFEQEHIEHIHASWASGPATAAWIASMLTGIPFSFTARAWDIFPPDGALKEKIECATFVRSETIYNINYMSWLAECDKEKMHVTYNGVPLRKGADAPVYMSSPYNLLALGRMVGKKGYAYLLRACKILMNSGVDFRLTLAGDGPLKRPLMRESRKLGLSEKVSFPGFVSYDKIPGLLRSGDILLMPSVVHSNGDRDGIPTVVMEALLHRVPVIATNVSGIPELIENHVTGLLIRQRDPEAIVQAVMTMINDRATAVKMAEQGRSRVREQFDPLKNHKKILDLYNQIGKQHPLPLIKENWKAGP